MPGTMLYGMASIDCSPLVFPVHGILQARMLEWAAISFFRRSSRPRDWTRVSCIDVRFFTIWAIDKRHCGNCFWPDGIFCSEGQSLEKWMTLLDRVNFFFEVTCMHYRSCNQGSLECLPLDLNCPWPWVEGLLLGQRYRRDESNFHQSQGVAF